MSGAGYVAFVKVSVAITVVGRVVTRLIGDSRRHRVGSEYVANFVTIAAGSKFNPHVTIGVGTEAYLNQMLAEPFPAFTFSVAGASVYQLGTFGTARKELKALPLAP